MTGLDGAILIWLGIWAIGLLSVVATEISGQRKDR